MWISNVNSVSPAGSLSAYNEVVEVGLKALTFISPQLISRNPVVAEREHCGI